MLRHLWAWTVVSARRATKFMPCRRRASALRRLYERLTPLNRRWSPLSDPKACPFRSRRRYSEYPRSLARKVSRGSCTDATFVHGQHSRDSLDARSHSIPSRIATKYTQTRRSARCHPSTHRGGSERPSQSRATRVSAQSAGLSMRPSRAQADSCAGTDDGTRSTSSREGD
jgi:hypothetical protein